MSTLPYLREYSVDAYKFLIEFEGYNIADATEKLKMMIEVMKMVQKIQLGS